MPLRDILYGGHEKRYLEAEENADIISIKNSKKYQRRENIEELLFDDSFYSQFENENRSRITESVSERGNTHTAQDEVTAEYKKAVDEILNGSKNVRDAVLIGYTPDIYQKLGMPSLPFVIGAGHIYSIAKTEEEAKSEGRFREKVNYHGLGQKAVENIYSKLLDPIMIIASKDVDQSHTPMRSTHSVVAIVDFESKDRKLLLPLELTAKRTVNGQRLDVNVLSTAYDKNSAELIREAIALENIGDVGIYYAKKEASDLLIGARVQFPKRLQVAIASNSIIHSFDKKINRNISTNTQSQQFLRWFGDWLNHPKDASKVVNDDGSPRVVYHGTDKDFTVFNSVDGTYWFPESEDYAEAMAEERDRDNGGRIMSVYLDMRNPYYASLEPGKFTNPAYEKPIIREAKKGGYDGVIIENKTDSDIEKDTFYIVFSPTQIKSATDNIGTFDRNNPDIRYQQRAKSEETLRAETAETILRDKYNVNVGKLLEGMDSTLENYMGSKSRKELEADILEAAVKTNEFSSGEGSFKHMSDAIESLFPSDIVNPADQLRQIAELTDLKPRTATETEISEIRNAMMSSLSIVSHGSTVTKDSMQRSIKTILILCRWDSDILFAVYTREANITRQSRISRHSNTSRREMNITEKSDCKMQSLFSWRAREDSNLRPIGS